MVNIFVTEVLDELVLVKVTSLEGSFVLAVFHAPGSSGTLPIPAGHSLSVSAGTPNFAIWQWR